ncbi:SDR family oxidoreductase [Sphingomonas sp. BK580]|uniref:SDR family oxidoreductase n=1 Tax=Sphingomonas sp. BK580 TaxID=2586972 RepID=UPI001619B788|nr:SDR family oxidoreductase [Sphingomonas sp. BK580]MBB3693602.1 NAD(P)-dependent dehydrogenase (short-subunit alcohol dehydrogenase family) [Sphingomonas sp. BK580]
MRTALITGANRSIGFETARQLGRGGYRVWLGSRDPEKGAAAADRLRGEGIDATALSIDVTDPDSVTSAAATVRERVGSLNLLINNAGIAGASAAAPSAQPLEDVRAVFDTNVFAPIRVTQAFLPLLKASDHAAVVMVSSGLGSLGWLSDPEHPFHRINLLGYNSSKTALNAVTVAFARELSASGIKVNSVDPGYTATDFNGHTGYRTVEQAAAGIVWLATLGSDGPSGRFYFEQQEVPW